MTHAKRLQEISDELLTIAGQIDDDADSRSTSPSATVRRASYSLQDAVDELMQKAAEKYKVELVPGSVRVLRERAA